MRGEKKVKFGVRQALRLSGIALRESGILNPASARDTAHDATLSARSLYSHRLRKEAGQTVKRQRVNYIQVAIFSRSSSIKLHG